MVQNKYYAGGLKPNVDKIVFRIIPDANAQVTALQNGEVDIINPQASADTITALKQTSAKVLTGAQASYDHLDLNFGSPVFSDAKVREAFLKTIPRQQILDSIVTPVDPKAKVLDSQIFLPNQSQYADTVKKNGSDKFGKVDIDGRQDAPRRCHPDRAHPLQHEQPEPCRRVPGHLGLGREGRLQGRGRRIARLEQAPPRWQLRRVALRLDQPGCRHVADPAAVHHQRWR